MLRREFRSTDRRKWTPKSVDSATVLLFKLLSTGVERKGIHQSLELAPAPGWGWQKHLGLEDVASGRVLGFLCLRQVQGPLGRQRDPCRPWLLD